VDVFVRKLRSKLQQASPDFNYIHTHFGVGYRFAAEQVGGEVAAAGASASPSPSVAAVAAEPSPPVAADPAPAVPDASAPPDVRVLV
jgi:hypothetical protein